MPTRVRAGDLFESGAHTLVNPVNSVGVMGAGLAAEFRRRYPGMYARYRVLCRNGNITPGSVMFDDGDGQHIANIATKDDWRMPSRLEWVEAGLETLGRHLAEEGVPSVAVPPVGCGLGGLDYRTVLPLMVKHLDGLECNVLLYAERRDLLWAGEVVAACRY